MRKGKLRISLVVLALVLAVSVAAGAAKYKDGVFIGWSDGDRHGYSMAIVMIENDKIVNVQLTEFNQYAEPKPATYPWQQYHEAMAVLPQMFVEANSADIDNITGATGTVTKAKQAVARALERALVDPPKTKYIDGTYYALSDDTAQSTGVAWVTIENDRIVKVELDEILPDGSWKNWETYPHKETVEGRLIMQQRFVEAQGPDVDIITGSTGSSTKYIQAVAKALKYAER